MKKIKGRILFNKWCSIIVLTNELFSLEFNLFYTHYDVKEWGVDPLHLTCNKSTYNLIDNDLDDPIVDIYEIWLI